MFNVAEQPGLVVFLQLGGATGFPPGVVDVPFEEAGKPFVVAVIDRGADFFDVFDPKPSVESAPKLWAGLPEAAVRGCPAQLSAEYR
jgi:hypothetical protein